jgi:hypothetical protein
LHDRGKRTLYRGKDGEWEAPFAIRRPSTRRDQLKALVGHVFRQSGRDVARRNAEAQHAEAVPAPRATLAEHLKEFEEIWDWFLAQWLAELSEWGRDRYGRLASGCQRDAFRIVQSFAKAAESSGARDFPFSVENVGDRLGISYQAVSVIRKRFVDDGVIKRTAPCVRMVSAARFRWLGPDVPF